MFSNNKNKIDLCGLSHRDINMSKISKLSKSNIISLSDTTLKTYRIYYPYNLLIHYSKKFSLRLNRFYRRRSNVNI